MRYRLKNPEIKENFGENLLRARGVQDIQEFCHPDESCLQSWRDLENIERAVKAIELTINDVRPYALIADCDVDGATSSAIIYQYLKRLNPKKEIQYFIHSGKQHGFSDLMEQLEDKDWSIIIAPDSATNDGEYISRFSCPVLCVDHHIKEENTIIPSNMILVNNQTSPNYKNKDLCGAGVTWQLCRALDDFFIKDLAWEYIDLCALGIVADMMSMLEVENQYLVQTGFKNIKNKMFRTLLEKQDYSMGGKITPITVAFYIVPLINAMIRVGSMDEKERLYLSFVMPEVMVDCHKRGAKGTKERLCVESTRECVNAKSHQDKMKEQMVEKLEAKIFKKDLLSNQVLFIRLEDDDVFPAELNGLLAMSIASKYKRPTIVARLNNEGYIRGSARAPGNTELKSFKNFMASTKLFEYTLGHDQALGISILDRNLSTFHEIANKELSKIDFGENYYDVDFVMRADDQKIEEAIEELCAIEQVYGQQNEEPVMAITNLNVSQNNVKIIGKNLDTLRIEKNGITYVKFRAKDLIRELKDFPGDMDITLVGKPNLNEWGGKTTPQIFITDLEIEDSRFAF
jgi:single-stranded-DNA-specific exonuclease